MLIDKLIGAGVALVTPFKMSGGVDLNALKQIVNHVVEGGIDYVVALGTTSETPTLRPMERSLIVKTIVEEVGQRVPVIIGVGGSCTSECVDALETSDFPGVDGILSVVPYYNKPTQNGIFQHFSALAKASPVPIVLYNIPSRCGVNMTAETTLRLANTHANIVAVKEASGDMEQVKEIIRLKPKYFRVISGDDSSALSIVAEGGAGVISVLANALPTEVRMMVRMALVGETEIAHKQQAQIQPLMDLLFAEGNPTGIKAMLHTLGLCENLVRLPLLPCSGDLQTRIRAALEPFTTPQR